MNAQKIDIKGLPGSADIEHDLYHPSIMWFTYLVTLGYHGTNGRKLQKQSY